MTNNEAEFWALHQGLTIAVRNGYSNMEITGDSQISVDMVNKLNNGKSWKKATSSWRTTGIIQDIVVLLKKIEYKVVNHVRGKGNQAADYLANWVSRGRGNRMDQQWKAVSGRSEWKELAGIIKLDYDQAT